MSKVYNTQDEIANKLTNLLLNIFNNNIRKTQLNIIPYIILGMINAESAVASDIAKKLTGDFLLFNLILLLGVLSVFSLTNFLTLMLFMIMLLNLLFLITNLLIQIKEFTLFSTTCFLMIITPYL